MTITRLCRALALLGMSLSFFVHAELTEQQKKVPLEQDTQDKSLAKVVLLAGPVEQQAGTARILRGMRSDDGLAQTNAGRVAGDGSRRAGRRMRRSSTTRRWWSSTWTAARSARCSKARVGRSSSRSRTPAWESSRCTSRWTFLRHKADELKSWIGGVFDKSISSRGHWDMTL